MIVHRFAPPTARAIPLGAVLRWAGRWWWWSVRAYVADRHLLPRPAPPPAPWPERWPFRHL
jgi:hypothetical protein